MVCPHCDWVRPPPSSKVAVHWRAATLSVIPGVGHIYKGHIRSGVMIFAVGNLFIVPLAILFAPASLGASLLVIPCYVVFVMLHAYLIDDLAPGDRWGALEDITKGGKL